MEEAVSHLGPDEKASQFQLGCHGRRAPGPRRAEAALEETRVYTHARVSRKADASKLLCVGELREASGTPAAPGESRKTRRGSLAQSAGSAANTQTGGGELRTKHP